MPSHDRTPGEPRRIDLHVHSTASDGTLPPEGVIEAAHAGGLHLVALTDHDTVAGVPAAAEAARGLGMELLPGIEVSATWEGGEVHVLGYGVDPSHPRLLEHGSWAGGLRLRRMEAMVERLREQGLEITMESVEEAAGVDRESLARPHLARALQAAGYVEHPWEAFDRYIGDEHQAYVPTNLLPVEEAIALVLEGGGVPVWAHPPEEAMDALLPRMRRAGLEGLEVLRPRWGQEKIRRLKRRARSAGLLVTGGSAWHGPEGATLGEFALTEDEVGPFLERVGMRKTP
jgi:3',5'-nucleoside bisphosphate phosphatase